MTDDTFLERVNEAVRNIHKNRIVQVPYDVTSHIEPSREIYPNDPQMRFNGEIEMFRTVIDAGSSALRAAMIMNGGAAIALLSFLSTSLVHAENFSTGLVGGVAQALLIFLVGIFLAGSASGTRYLAQYAYYHSFQKPIVLRTGHFLNFITITLSVISFFSFISGGLLAYYAIA